MILVSLYELGHGIYPAAFLTIGACARYAVALGLDRDIFLWDHTESGWAAMEEKHRAWWAVVILERHMNIDSPRRHLCIPDPCEKHFLPISDEDWNSGVRPALSQTGCPSPYTVSAPANNKLGKFARLAQASHLLARVMRHIGDTQADPHFLDTEKSLLDHALRSLLSLTVAEEQRALLLLHSFPLAFPSANKESAQYCYREVTELTSKVTLPIARRLKGLLPSDAHAPSPLLLDWMYRSVIAYNNIRETNTAVLVDGYVETVREAMEGLGRQWGVGGILISLPSGSSAF
ncbi:fungal specific transcription factor domain-containing protein [Aspergillus mulundensis]|uniref:Xylanolytic transcriptional activator regulatory domain-containing protein n=1 Tax=Aspergillus mulundensis TaxID=1810919 RepID=A0A3D8QAZ1_9EURO|nr:hypothetical protein DSM5745_11202 [Aspergillus mulundensis]RDW58996.1 hypothetical protein DSM5745_11202 [Aspergillus mulundensis]